MFASVLYCIALREGEVRIFHVGLITPAAAHPEPHLNRGDTDSAEQWIRWLPSHFRTLQAMNIEDLLQDILPCLLFDYSEQDFAELFGNLGVKKAKSTATNICLRRDEAVKSGT